MTTNTPTNAALIRVDFQARPRLKSLGGGLYEKPGVAGFFARPVCQRRQREVRLKAHTERLARAELGMLLGKIAQFEAGIGPDPFRDATAKTVRDLVQFYLDQNCPRKRQGAQRTAQTLREEKTRAQMLLTWPGSKLPAHQITLEVCTQYHGWRVKRVKHGKGGDRQVDKDLVTLSNVFRCAMRAASLTGITANPLAQERPRFRDPQLVKHCRDAMPRSGDELHALARYLFDSGPRTEVMGWLTLIAAITGQRVNEVLKLRLDAEKNGPGFLSGRRLYQHRSQSSKGTYGHVDLTADELACIEAHRTWHAQRFPAGTSGASPWYFPSPADPRKPLSDAALTHALRRIVPALAFERAGGEPPKITAHGLRAFRVNVLRGRALPDAEIALRIGQKTQGKLIVEVYGEGLDYTLSFMPGADTAPAWQHFTSAPRVEQLQLL